jgi:L-amino acid N-acyltransferase YncA
MNEKITIREKRDSDNNKIMDILNSFVEDSFAVYSKELVASTFAIDSTNDSRVFLVIESQDGVIGFGMITPYKKYTNFNHTGVLAYFIKEGFTGLGLGSKLLKNLLYEGNKIGITNYLAHISSHNNQSLCFHKKHGFEEVGRFKNVSVKFGKSVDIVWVQKDFAEILEKE